MTPDEARGYLAGLIDGEGYVRDVSGSTRARQVQIANTEESIIAGILEACAALGIVARATGPYGGRAGRQSIWSVNINHRVNLEKLAALPLRSAKKRAKLEAILALYRDGYYQQTIRDPLDEATVRHLYQEEGLTIPQVAARMGESYKRVHGALRRYGIPTHSGAEKSALIWATRRERAAAGPQSG